MSSPRTRPVEPPTSFDSGQSISSQSAAADPALRKEVAPPSPPVTPTPDTLYSPRFGRLVASELDAERDARQRAAELARLARLADQD